MTNEELRAWLDWLEKYLADTCAPIAAIAGNPLAQLRLMFQPTKEEKVEFFWWQEEFQYLLDGKILSRDEIAYLFGQIKSIIEREKNVLIEKRTVTRARLQEFAEEVLGSITVSRVFGLTEILLAELGIEISEKGDVPIISEEGFSNEEKP